MTSAIRILIADDSVVNRQMLKKLLSNANNIEVVGVAQNGKIALERIPQCNPDLVILDVEMPEMDGLEALKQLRQDHPKLPVIMFSALTAKGASTTIEALALGANDYVTKPNSRSVLDSYSPEAVERYVYDNLIPRIYALHNKALSPDSPQARVLARRQKAAEGIASEKPPQSDVQSGIQSKMQREGTSDSPLKTRSQSKQKIQAVGIGVSTGGPNALAEVLSHLPERLGLPVFIVQHMPPLFTQYLAERLDHLCKLKVCEAEDGMRVQADTVYLAPGDFHMELRQEKSQIFIALNQQAPENSCRPAVDVLFRSMAEIYGAHSLGIVMTGMGQDGLRGAQHIQQKGGALFAQDEATSTIWGMPGYIARAGLAEKILPLSEISQAIVQRIGR